MFWTGCCYVKKRFMYFLRDLSYSSSVSLVCLLGHKIFTQPDAYCHTNYCPNTRVDYYFMEKISILSSLLKSNYYSSA